MTHYGYQQAPGFPPHQSYLPQPNYYGPQITTGQAPPTSAVLYPNAAYHPQPSMAPGGNQQALTLPGCPAQQVYSSQTRISTFSRLFSSTKPLWTTNNSQWW